MTKFAEKFEGEFKKKEKIHTTTMLYGKTK